MSEPTYTFRTAVGGFHKGDVSAYIAKTAAEHQQALAELQAKITRLEKENAMLEQQLQMLSLPELLDQMLEPEPSSEPEPSAETVPEAVSEAVTAPEETPAETLSSLKERELLAYRRAEAAERLACQRAKKLYGDIQSICDQSAATMDNADAVTQDAMGIILAQLQRIRGSVDGLSTAMQSSSEALRAMVDLVPDPAEGLEEEL